MSELLEPIALLAAQFSRLPGIGSKSAQRLAFHIIDLPEEEVASFAAAMTEAKARIHYCSICGNFTESDICEICADRQRTSEVLCVVRDPRDIMAMERTRDYRGRYHVLHGILSPMDGVGPQDIRIQELLDRIKPEQVHEVILGHQSGP